MYNNSSFNNHDLNAYNNVPPFDNRLSSKRGSTYGRGRLSQSHVDPTGLNNLNNSQSLDQNNQMDHSDAGDQTYHHSSTANHGLGQDSSFDNLSATSRPKDTYGRQLDQSYGKDNQSYGKDNQAYGNDNQAYGNDNQAYGKDNRAFGNDNQALGNDNQAFGSNNQAFGSNNQSFGDNNQALGNNNSNHHKMAAGAAGAGALGAAGALGSAAGRHGDHNSSFGSNDRSLDNQDYGSNDRGMAAGPGATSQGYDSNFDNNNSSYGNQGYGNTDSGMAAGPGATSQGYDSTFDNNNSSYGNQNYENNDRGMAAGPGATSQGYDSAFDNNNSSYGNQDYGNTDRGMAAGPGATSQGYDSTFDNNNSSYGNQDYGNTDRGMAAGPGATSQGYDSNFDNNNSSYGNQDYGNTDRGMAADATGQDSFNNNTSNVRNTEIPSPEKADSYGDKTAHDMVTGAGALGVAGAGAAGAAGAHRGLSNKNSTHSNMGGNDYPENLGERTASGYSSRLDTDRYSQQTNKNERALDEQPHRHDHSSGALGTGRQSSTGASRHDHSSGALGAGAVGAGAGAVGAGAVGAGAVGAGAVGAGTVGASDHYGNNNSIDSRPTHTSSVDPSRQGTRDSSDLRQKESAGTHATGQTGAATGATSGGVVPGLGSGALGTGAVESVVKNDQGINENTGREMEEEEQKAAVDHKPSATEKIKGNLEKVAGKLTGNQTKVAKGDDIAHGRSL